MVERLSREMELPERLRTELMARCDTEDADTIAELVAADTLPQSEDPQSGIGLSRLDEPEEGPRRHRLTVPLPDPEERYDELEQIGRGGMGEVWRVRDRRLQRTVVRKLVLPGMPEEVTARFVTEARITGQLQHPGIVSLHELGELTDGRPYYTMDEVRGRTLTEAIEECHALAGASTSEMAWSGWTLRRLVDALQRACEAVGYAHSRGVVHRDLKPDNIMVGPFGEVIVLDWGLAKRLGEEERFPGGSGEHRSGGVQGTTQVGSVLGTPSYMPPEQAAGDLDQIGPASDVYALGAVLYQILTGVPPFVGRPEEMLAPVLSGSFEPPGRMDPAIAVPEELERVCLMAMSWRPEDRYPEATELASAIGDWLEGARRREQALELVSRAEGIKPEAVSLRKRAGELAEAAERMLGEIKVNAPVERKRPAWDLEGEAEELKGQADLKELEYLETLRSALNLVPELPEAHCLLADHYKERHAAAEARRDGSAVAVFEVLVRTHDGGAHRAYLEGKGALTLVSDPPGAEAVLSRYVRRERRLVAEEVRSLGRTPLEAVPLAMGSYLVTLRAEGRGEVRYPVSVGREEHWDGRPPGENEPRPVYLPQEGEIGPDEVYVPAGWFWCGGDPEAREALPGRRLWAEAFAIGRFPVSNRQLIEYLDDLVATGREEEALRHAPRERAGTVGEQGALIFGRGADGRFVLRPDADGDEWDLDWPACMVDLAGAAAWCRWLAGRTGLPWRLPGELEWEKAARGVDGRIYPWGDHLDPSWCCMRDTHEEKMLPAVVDSFPVDESPYGVRGMGGNARDWCVNVLQDDGLPPSGGRVRTPEGPRGADRGGGWSNYAEDCRAAARLENMPIYRYYNLGFRALRTL